MQTKLDSPMSSFDDMNWKEKQNKSILIDRVNEIGRTCMDYRDYGGGRNKNSLFDALPIIAVVGDQSSGKSSLLESIVGIDFLPKRSGFFSRMAKRFGFVTRTRTPLVLHLMKVPPYENMMVEFSHLPQRFFYDLSEIHQEIAYQTNRNARKPNPSPFHIFIYSPDVIHNLTLIDLPTLTNAEDVEKMVKTYINKPNCIILAVSPAGQDLAKSDAMKLAREVDPSGDRTIGVLTKLDLMDEGTHALNVLEGRADHPWVGVANRPPHHETGMTMYSRRKREHEYFATSPHYAHLADRMGSEYLANLLSQRLESLIEALNMDSLINKRIHELEADPKPDQWMLLLHKSIVWLVRDR